MALLSGIADFALVPPVPLSGPTNFWNMDLNFMLGLSVGCGIHLFSSVGLCVFFFLNMVTSHIKGVEALTPIEIENHLEMGRQFLAHGQYSDALSHYHAAVEGDPLNYLTFFKRAAVYLALGRSKPALEDLNQVVDLKPDFLAARMQRGNVFLKQGRLDEAHIDFEWILRFDPMNEEAVRHYGVIEPLKEDMRMALVFLADKNYIGAVEVLTRLLQECPWNIELRERRAECFEAIGDINAAISDLRPTMKMKPDNTNGFLKLSQLYYRMGDAEESLGVIRECLKLDPDHKNCFAHYKKVKKLAAALKGMQDASNSGDYEECVLKAKSALKIEEDSQRLTQYAKARMCHCLSKGANTVEAIQVCTDAMALGEDVNVLCDRAEAHIANEDFDDALQDFQKATNLDEHSQRAHEGLRKAQRLLKQSKKRDYYKILGVKRTAGKREILKAYRKHASKWHPDNFQGDDKKAAEKKFIDIAAAKEVLTDPEKRQQFDNGEDPLDPESQAGQNFNPFGNGFNPFGGNGGPFTFKFHFN